MAKEAKKSKQDVKHRKAKAQASDSEVRKDKVKKGAKKDKKDKNNGKDKCAEDRKEKKAKKKKDKKVKKQGKEEKQTKKEPIKGKPIEDGTERSKRRRKVRSADEEKRRRKSKRSQSKGSLSKTARRGQKGDERCAARTKKRCQRSCLVVARRRCLGRRSRRALGIGVVAWAETWRQVQTGKAAAKGSGAVPSRRAGQIGGPTMRLLGRPPRRLLPARARARKVEAICARGWSSGRFAWTK
eukprot:TRINITY_DN30078_c0_g1_i3.p1 TRINITY_DN30078_c0_g1~~TRINITY_DN30078_c0_g1_i3.p1  ORF type:complete len:241 (-),score=40.29 TRINITY_DN30078_c0_g1_i3:723-1445(-)